MSPTSWFFTEPRVTLGYATFDFEVEESLPIGALPLVSHGQCEIENGCPNESDEVSSLKRETIEMLDCGRISSAALVDLLEPAPPCEAFQELFARTRRALAQYAKREAAKVEALRQDRVHVRFAR